MLTVRVCPKSLSAAPKWSPTLCSRHLRVSKHIDDPKGEVWPGGQALQLTNLPVWKVFGGQGSQLKPPVPGAQAAGRAREGNRGDAAEPVSGRERWGYDRRPCTGELVTPNSIAAGSIECYSGSAEPPPGWCTSLGTAAILQ